MNRLWICSRLGTEAAVGCRHEWLPREVLETKGVGGASTVKVEAVVCTTLTAHSEPHN